MYHIFNCTKLSKDFWQLTENPPLSPIELCNYQHWHCVCTCIYIHVPPTEVPELDEAMVSASCQEEPWYGQGGGTALLLATRQLLLHCTLERVGELLRREWCHNYYVIIRYKSEQDFKYCLDCEERSIKFRGKSPSQGSVWTTYTYVCHYSMMWRWTAYGHTCT